MKEARSSIVTSMMRRVCVATPPIMIDVLDGWAGGGDGDRGGGGGDRGGGGGGGAANIQSPKFKYTHYFFDCSHPMAWHKSMHDVYIHMRMCPASEHMQYLSCM